MDREPLHSLNALQVYEPFERHTRCTSCEAEHLRLLVTIERLERSPPPNDDRIRARIARVLCCRPPFIDVYVWGTRDKEFHLLLVELRNG